MENKVYLLGAGPGDPGLLTIRSRDILAQADVIVYDALANESFLSYARPDAELIYVGKIAGKHALSQDGINALLIEKAKEGKSVARLKGGDPYIFGRGGEEAGELLKAGVSFEEVPGISSTIAAPAYAGIPLTHREYSSSVTIITGHETPDKSESNLDWHALARSASTLVFVMGMKNLPDIVRRLIDAGLSPETPAALVYRGTTPLHRSIVRPLAQLPQAAIDENFTNPSVIVVGDVCSLHDSLNWYEARPLLGRRIVVTRAREQASGMAGMLASLGAEVIQCPTIRIEPVADTAPLDAAIDTLAGYQWIIFTSVNGVRLFWKRLREKGMDARAFASSRLAAIGPATAKALEERGLYPDVVPEKYVAEGVIAALEAKADLKGARILIPRARVAREVLPEELRKAGAEVDILPVYDTVPECGSREKVLSLMEEGQLDCVTFGSSSTVENFLALFPAETLKAHPEVKLAAIGPITRKTLEKHGLTCAVMPEQYTIQALVEKLVETYK